MGNQTPVVIIADHKTTPEGSAIQQLNRTAALAHIDAAAGMPDLHPGRGYPVGAAFYSHSHLYPALIGADIGCGMSLWQSDLAARKTSADKLLRRIGELESPLDDDWLPHIAATGTAADHPYRHTLGTIGGGNHFAEIQRVDAVLAPAQLPPDFDADALCVLVHSGSRGYGGAILRAHIEQHGHAPLAAASPDAAAYLAAHDAAVAYAKANRSLIAARLAQNLGATLHPVSDTAHNQLVHTHLNGVDGWLHRKGAAAADAGLVVIAGSRGSASYLVRPTGRDAGNLASLAHGAGRKWQRGACKARLSGKYRPQELLRNPYGGHIICADKTLLYDEAPQAYRNIEHTIAALTAFGLIEPVLRLTPVLTYKTRGDAE